MEAEVYGRLTCRMARLEDHDAILAIGVMYDGLDYLPGMLYEYLHDPLCICVVGEVDNKVVSIYII